jgi:hypothetical protein
METARPWWRTDNPAAPKLLTLHNAHEEEADLTQSALGERTAPRRLPDRDGQVTIFAAIDHCTAECLGIHAVKKAHRFEALEPIRQAIREQSGSFSVGAAAGVRLRHDHGLHERGF